MKFSIRQILASAAGAVIAALIASVFGVKGTIVGVAIGSAAATFGTALVAQSIERGHDAVKQVVDRAPETGSLLRRLGTTGASGASESESSGAAASAAVPPGESHEPAQAGTRGAETTQIESPAAPASSTQRLEVSAVAGAPATERLRARTLPPPPRRFSWQAIAGTAAIVFVLALLFVTAVELIAGKPLSSIFGDSGTGTTLNNIVNSPSSPPTSTTTTTPNSTSTSTTSASSSTSTTTTTTTGSSSTTSTSTTVPSTTSSTSNPGATTTTTGGAAGG